MAMISAGGATPARNNCTMTADLACIGAGLVIDGELEWLTGGLVPSEAEGSIHEQIERSGAPAGFLDELDARGHAELGVDVGEVGLHCAR